MKHCMNFILIKIKKCSCASLAVELNGNSTFALSGGEIIPIICQTFYELSFVIYIQNYNFL